jgi:Ser/Thr protein kinase RdoA (MazF antagonist)
VDTKTVEALVSVGDRYVGRAPTFQVEPGWWSEVEAVTRHLDMLLGVRTVVLRLVHADDAVRGRGGRVVYHMQALDEPRYDVLDATELDALIAELPRVVDELEAAGLPITLVHGDFHPGNWRSDGVGRVIVDWADTFVGHPAIDIRRLQDFLPEDRRDHAAQLWARAWQRELPGSDPLRALGPISILSPLTYALTYQRFLDHIEPSERVYHADDPALCLRAALTAWRA